MDLIRLREQTAGEHAQTEDTVPLMSSTLTRAEYVANLRSFYRVVGAWDRWVDAHAPDDLLPLLAGRRRSTLLQHDLGAMGAGVLSDDQALPDSMMDGSAVSGDPRSVFLGRMYVMEGSTLGGQYIARHVEETLGLASGEGNSYFRGYGEATGERWREFRTVLQTLPESEAETVIASAKEMFSIFREGMREPAFSSPNTFAEDSFVEIAADR
jgi:heme oxygenase